MFQTLAPEELLKQYNLSLAQTLLFRATVMEIQVEDNYQPVFRKIKQLGLIYSIHDDRISLEGRLSRFKLTEKYGSGLCQAAAHLDAGRQVELEGQHILEDVPGKEDL